MLVGIRRSLCHPDKGSNGASANSTLPLHFTSLHRQLNPAKARYPQREQSRTTARGSQAWQTRFSAVGFGVLCCPSWRVALLGMIEVNSEQIVTFAELAKRLPRRRRGRPTAVSTIHRWRLVGIKGIRLEAIRVGCSWVTSLQAYQRFCDALTSNVTKTDSEVKTPKVIDQQQIERRLDDLGI